MRMILIATVLISLSACDGGSNFSENEGYYPFIAQMSDPEPHGREIFQEAEKGTFGEIADFAIRNADIKTD